MKCADFTKILTCKIRKKVFRLIWKRPPKKRTDPKDILWDGQCDHPKDKNKELWLWPNPDHKEMLGTVIHECTHGAFPDLEETSVQEHEQAIMRLLTRMGIEVRFNPK